MKYLLLLCSVLISLASASENVNQVTEALKLCQQSSGVPKDILERSTVPDDATFKDFLHCAFKKLNLFKSDSTLDSARIEKMLPSGLTSEERDSVIGNCFSLRGANEVDTPLEVYKCYRKYVNKVGFDLEK